MTLAARSTGQLEDGAVPARTQSCFGISPLGQAKGCFVPFLFLLGKKEGKRGGVTNAVSPRPKIGRSPPRPSPRSVSAGTVSRLFYLAFLST